MIQFEEGLAWILMDFKQDKKDFEEVIIAIEELIVRSLGLNLYRSKELKQAHEILKS